LYNLKN